MTRIRTLLNQLRTRLILGVLAFLLALTGAVALVVRDSLRFLATNMEAQGVAQALVQNSLNDILKATLLTIGYFAILVIIGVILASRTITDPIQRLVEGTRSIAAGNLNVRIPVKSNDELGVLADSFNKMADELQTRNTDLVKANASLSEREAHLRLITEVTTDAIYDWNIVAGKTLWNDGYQALFGYPSGGVHEHLWWRDRIHPDDRERIINHLETALTNHEEFLSYEFRYRRADGSYAHVIDRGFIFYAEDGTPLREVGAMIDITDRVILSEAQAQAALEERQRLARELHDSVTQSLYSLTLLAEASRRIAQNGDVNRVVDNIARLGDTAQQALKEMRLLVYELRPLALEQAGLAEALQHRLDAVEKRAGVDAQLRVKLNAELPPNIENGLYRIAQEALNNSLKHAEATTISVSLKTQEEHVELEIIDNGKGFDVDAIQDHGGLGMISMRERVEAMHGEYSVTSKPGEGTRIWVGAPLKLQDGEKA
jgi:PAS domain S-box-containing protein